MADDATAQEVYEVWNSVMFIIHRYCFSLGMTIYYIPSTVVSIKTLSVMFSIH